MYFPYSTHADRGCCVFHCSHRPGPCQVDLELDVRKIPETIRGVLEYMGRTFTTHFVSNLGPGPAPMGWPQLCTYETQKLAVPPSSKLFSEIEQFCLKPGAHASFLGFGQVVFQCCYYYSNATV